MQGVFSGTIVVVFMNGMIACKLREKREADEK